jgi:two-component system KDP operon response regulator KdpE
MKSKTMVLVVEKDAPMRKYLKLFLTSKGYGILESDTAGRAAEITEEKRPELVLYDLMTPGMTAVEFVETVRKESSVPIIILSSNDEQNEKIALLLSGADDYLSKPFSPEELHARAQVALRRSLAVNGTSVEPTISFDNVSIDLQGHRLLIDGRDVHLTPTEFRLLKCLTLSPGKALSFKRLVSEIRDRKIHGDPLAYLRVYIMQLRQKMEPNPATPRYIVTVRGHGYVLQRGTANRRVSDAVT